MKKKKFLALAMAIIMMGAAFAGCGTQGGDSSAPSEAETSSAVSSEGEESAEEESEPESSEALSSQESEPEAAGAGIYPGTPDADMITVNINTEPPDMNTITTTDTVSFAILKNTMENLTRFDENDEVQPGAAESWDISDDGLTYTFHLREGMIWENGDPVTAKDFEFAWKTALSPEAASEYAYFLYPIEGAQAYNEGSGSADDVKITAVDDLTFEVVLHTPTGYFLSQTTFGTMCPLNEAFYTEVGAEKYGTEAEYMLSNGPFTVESWTHESEMVLAKNEDYYNADAIKLPKVRLVMILDNNSRLNAFQGGEIDMTVLDANMVDALRGAGYETLDYPDGSCFYLEYNMEHEVISNLNLRKAINYAIDRETYVNSVLKNSCTPATSLTTNAINGLAKPFPEEVGELVPVTGNPEEAKAALELAKTELGMDEAEIAAKISIILDDTDNAVKTGAYIQEQLKTKLGMDVTVENMPFKSRLDRMTTKDFSIVFAGWGLDYNDPNTYLDMFVTGGGNNHGNYSNPDYDKLIADAAVETDPEVRMGYFYEAEKIVVEDCVVSPVYWRVVDYAVSEKVTGIYRTAFQDMMFINAEIVN